MIYFARFVLLFNIHTPRVFDLLHLEVLAGRCQLQDDDHHVKSSVGESTQWRQTACLGNNLSHLGSSSGTEREFSVHVRS